MENGSDSHFSPAGGGNETYRCLPNTIKKKRKNKARRLVESLADFILLRVSICWSPVELSGVSALQSTDSGGSLPLTGKLFNY